MSVGVELSWGKLPLGTCFTDPETYKDAIFALLVAQITGDFSGIVKGSNTPSVSDQDKAWLKTDQFGRPIGIYTFYGQWIAPYRIGPSVKELMIWKDSEAALWAYDGGDGTDPSTSPPTPTTGSFWQRDTDFGKDDGSVPFRVPVGIGKGDVAYDGNPETIITPGDTGGVERVDLTVAEIPAHHHTYNTATAGAVGPYAAGSALDFLATVTGNTGGGDSHANMPPYYGVIFAKRTARQFLVG